MPTSPSSRSRAEGDLPGEGLPKPEGSSAGPRAETTADDRVDVVRGDPGTSGEVTARSDDAPDDAPDRAPDDAPDGAPDGAADEPGEEQAAEGSSRRRRTAVPTVTPPPPERLEGAVEAVLLAAGEALSAERIRDLLGLPSAVHVRDAIAAIRARWTVAGLSVEIQDVAGGHRVVTRPEFAEFVRRLWRRATSDRLSQTLLETLSIVAYKQPVARAEIERIRGVQCGETLRGLLERRLIKVSGRSDQPGRPLLYATTTRFLEVFGLAGLEDLPSAKDLARL